MAKKRFSSYANAELAALVAEQEVHMWRMYCIHMLNGSVHTLRQGNCIAKYFGLDAPDGGIVMIATKFEKQRPYPIIHLLDGWISQFNSWMGSDPDIVIQREMIEKIRMERFRIYEEERRSRS